MNFKFLVGQTVEFTPRGGKVGLFTVVRQMPEEYQALDRKYRIQGEQGTEWSAFEFDLTASDRALVSMRHRDRCETPAGTRLTLIGLSKAFRISERFAGDGDRMFEHTCKLGLRA